MKKFIPIICCIAVFVGIIGASALTINLYYFNYNLTSLHNINTSNVTLSYPYQKIQHTPSVVQTDAQQGTYLKVTTYKKVSGSFQAVANKNFTNPAVGVVDSTPYSDRGTGTFKYRFYDYGIQHLEGQVLVYNADEIN